MTAAQTEQMEQTSQTDFEPKILGFLCNWCSYASADLAGVSRIQYPPNLRVIRVMCSGRVEASMVLEALKKGVDGVIITGCHIGDCHYQTGNHQTQYRYDALMDALGYTRFGTERIRLEWISASEGMRFGEVITEFTEKIRALGPTPVKGEDGALLVRELQAVEDLFGDHAERTLIGKKGELTGLKNVYGERIDTARYNEIIAEGVRSGYIRNYILLSAMDDPVSVKALASELRIPPQTVLSEISVLMRKNLLALDHVDGTTPKFRSIAQEEA